MLFFFKKESEHLYFLKCQNIPSQLEHLCLDAVLISYTAKKFKKSLNSLVWWSNGPAISDT